MVRRLLGIASFLSLLLCLTLVTMWVRSYRSCVALTGTSWIKSWEGEIEYVKMIELSAPAEFSEHGNFGAELTLDPPKPMKLQVHAVGGLMLEPGAFGFGFTHGTHFFMQEERFYESSWDCYIAPYWLFVTITALLPITWVAVRRFWPRKVQPVTITSSDLPASEKV